MDMERNKLIRLFALLPLATVLTMCTDDMVERGLGYDEAHTPIALNVAFEQQEEADTRASNTINNTGFDPTYQFLRLFADQGDESYTEYATTYKPTAATTIAVQSGAAVPYFKAGGTAVNVYGWYPALDSSKSFTVQNDQSTQDNYVKSDLLLADKVQSTRNLSTGVVTAAILPFRHAMSKIVLNVTAGDGVTVNNVRLAGVKKTVAINDATKTALTLGSASGDAGEVTVHSTSFTSSSGQQTMAAVIPPQSVSGDFIKVNVTVGGSKRDVTFALGEAKTLATNQTYTLTLTVNKQNIGATLTILGWTASSTAVNIEPSTEGGGGLLSLDLNIFDTTYSTTSPTLNVTATTDCSSVQATSTNTGVATVSFSGKVTTITAVHAGTAKVVISEVGGDDFGVVEVNVAKATTSVTTAPTKRADWTYDTNSYSLLTSAGASNYGTMKYSTDNSTWSTSIPTGQNAGSYTVYYKAESPNYTDYQDDESTWGSHTVTVSRAAGSITFDPTSVTGLNKVNGTTTTVTATATGTISYTSSSNANVATASVSGSTITVTAKGTAGTATLSFSVAQSTNYSATTGSLSVTTVDDPGVALASSTVGMIVGANGKAYNSLTDMSGITTAVAVVGYKNGSSGYAIALVNSYDGNSQPSAISWNTINGWTSNNGDKEVPSNMVKSGFPSAPTGTKWYVLTKDHYSQVFHAMGSTVTSNSSYYYDSNVNSKITAAGGTALSGSYWSCSDYSSRNGWSFYSGGWDANAGKSTTSYYVRPCLAF